MLSSYSKSQFNQNVVFTKIKWKNLPFLWHIRSAVSMCQPHHPLPDMLMEYSRSGSGLAHSSKIKSDENKLQKLLLTLYAPKTYRTTTLQNIAQWAKDSTVIEGIRGSGLHELLSTCTKFPKFNIYVKFWKMKESKNLDWRKVPCSLLSLHCLSLNCVSHQREEKKNTHNWHRCYNNLCRIFSCVIRLHGYSYCNFVSSNKSYCKGCSLPSILSDGIGIGIGKGGQVECERGNCALQKSTKLKLSVKVAPAVDDWTANIWIMWSADY